MTSSLPVTVELATSPDPLGRYSKAVVAIATAALMALVAAASDESVSGGEVVDVAIALLTAVGVYLVPNLPQGPGRYAKAGVAVGGAALLAVAAALSGGITGSEWLLVILAGLKALGVGVVPNTGPPPETERKPDGRHEAGSDFPAPLS